MARKPKVRRPEGEEREEFMKPQIERFKEAARKADADETGGAFEREFCKIVQPKRKYARR
jgi:hypothetical protein